MKRRLSGHLPSVAFGAVLAISAVALLNLVGCGSSTPAPAATHASLTGTAAAQPERVGPYEITTTCGMVTDIVRVIAGEHATVSGMIGEGIDPHLFTAGREDVQALLSADVVFYSGLMLEGRLADNFAQVGRKGKPVYAVTEGLDKKLLREPPEFEGHWDPHVWMDVSAWSQCAGFAGEALAEFDATHADSYKANAQAYQTQLAELHNYCRQVIGIIPEKSRYLVTAHDAFGYFGSAYGIEVRAIQGVSTESEAGLADINNLVDFIIENQVPAIFVESSVSEANIKAVIVGCAGRDWELKIGAKLFSDAMGAPGTYEGTYIGMMDHNATKIARALGGEAPAGGWQGKLATEEQDATAE